MRIQVDQILDESANPQVELIFDNDEFFYIHIITYHQKKYIRFNCYNNEVLELLDSILCSACGTDNNVDVDSRLEKFKNGINPNKYTSKNDPFIIWSAKDDAGMNNNLYWDKESNSLMLKRDGDGNDNIYRIIDANPFNILTTYEIERLCKVLNSIYQFRDKIMEIFDFNYVRFMGSKLNYNNLDIKKIPSDSDIKLNKIYNILNNVDINNNEVLDKIRKIVKKNN